MSEYMTYVEEALAQPWVRALLWIVGSAVAAKIIDLVLCGAVGRLAKRTRTEIDEKLIALLHGPVYTTVLLVGLYWAVRQFEIDATTLAIIVSALQTIAILIWLTTGMKIVNVALEGLNRLSDRVHWIETRTVPLFSNLMRLLIFGVAVYCLLVAWKLNLAPWLASAGIAGIAIGFAAKDTLANLFGGLFVIIDRPYAIGDYINLGTGERGQVTQIGLRSTRILTRDDIEVTVPNAQIANSTIINESGGPSLKSRVIVNVGVAYGSDIEQVRELLIRAAESVEDVVGSPEPRAHFSELGDSALIFRVKCWIGDPAQRGRVIDALNSVFYKRLNEAGITIPFPQRDVHLRPSVES